MKKILFVSVLLFLLAVVNIDAQSGRGRTDNGAPQKRSQPTQPSPTPTPVVPVTENNPADEEALKISTELVSFPVSVLDRRGRYVFDLKKEEFQIFEDGKPQEITFFANTEQPFTVVLMLDVSLSTKFKIGEIQQAAIAFVSQLRPEDKVMVVAFCEQVMVLSEFTSDRKELVRAIRTTKFMDGTSLYDAFDMVAGREMQRVKGRKAVVLFTDGVDTTSRKAYAGKNLRDSDELDALVFPIQYDTYNDVRRMERDGAGAQGDIKLPGPVPITISKGDGKEDREDRNRTNDPQAPGTTKKEYEDAERYLRELAFRTGGKVYRADTTNDLTGAFSKIAQELRQQYSLGYYPPDIEKTDTLRKVKVKVTRPDLVVKAREAYSISTAGGGARKTKQKSP